MLKIYKLFLISLFVTFQFFASEKSFISKITDQANEILVPENFIKMFISGSETVQSKIQQFAVSDTFKTAQDLSQQSFGLAQQGLNQAWDYAQEGLDYAQQGLDKAIEIIPQKAIQLTNAAKNNPYKTIVILGGILAAGKIIKDSLSKKNEDNDGKTELVVGFKVGVKTPNPIKLAVGMSSLYYAYTMRNNIIGWFAKKTAA